MDKIRHLIKCSIALAFILGIASCARKDTRTTITFWAMGREAEVVRALLPEFERMHPSVQVKLSQVPWTAAHEKLLTAYAADHLPNLCQLGNTWMAEFHELGALTPLDDRVSSSTSIAQSDYFPGIWQTNVLKTLELAPTVYGVPWYVDTRLIFYRKDLLKAAGFSHPPTRWGEWLRMMQAIQSQNLQTQTTQSQIAPPRYAILLPVNEFEQLLSFSLQQKDQLLVNDQANFASPGYRKALSFYAEIFARGYAPKMSETQISNVWDEFFNGMFVFYVSGPWNIRELRNRAPAELVDAWGTAPLPGPDGLGVGIAGGTSLVLFESKRADDSLARQHAAWQLVEFLSRPDIQARFYLASGNLPPRRSSWATPTLINDRYATAFRDQLERVKPVPQLLEWERIAQLMRLSSERVVRADTPIDVAIAELQAEVNQLLSKRRWVQAQRKARAQ